MSAEKVFYGPVEYGAPPSGERAAGSRVSLAGVFGVVALVTAALALALVLNNMSQQMAKDHEEIMILKASAERDQQEIQSLKMAAERDLEEVASFKMRAEEDRRETLVLMEKIAMLEAPIHDTGSNGPEAVGPGDDPTTESVHKRQKRSLSNLDDILTKISELRNGLPAGSQGAPGEKRTVAVTGGVYIRWGRNRCPNSATTVYSGVAGGTWYGQSGGGTNYLCLPRNPQWGKYQDGFQGYSAWIYGAEYQITADVPFGDRSLHDQNVVCSVCHTYHNSVLMIPARKTCPDGWYLEYDGYLMAEFRDHAGSKEFVCMDKQPQAAQGGHGNQDGALFYPTEAHCGSLPCPAYAQGRELTCVVCVK
ncbi:uncharacterized protein LOC118417352 [Branchiostoma floridae]|uniref:Uncharacterized protein LOC118417352 n=1 Tax=Branchiostoma floridae TaxID=7739 RepID=A0A9J7MS29_BRAFL|nr:uncharacterized protein LOC118417352 [Branchiostoma floridae]